MDQNQIIEYIKLCMEIKKDVDKYCDYDFIIEGDIIINNVYGYNNNVINTKIDIANSAQIHNTILSNDNNNNNYNYNYKQHIIKNNDNEYTICQGRINFDNYFQKLKKIFGLKDIYVKNIYDDPIIFITHGEYDFGFNSKYIYCIYHLNYMKTNDFRKKILFLYNIKLDTLTDLDKIYNYDNVFTVCSYSEIRINVKYNNCKYVIFFDISRLLDNDGIIKVYQYTDTTNRIICEVKKNSMPNYYITYEKSELLDDIGKNIKEKEDVIRHIIEILNKHNKPYPNKNSYDGMNLVTKSNMRIPMPIELYNEFKDLDEETIIGLTQCSMNTNHLNEPNKRLCN